MKHKTILILGSLLFATFLGYLAERGPGRVTAAAERRADEKADVWRTVEARWQAWLDDDLERYNGIHHPRWRRWALQNKDLEGLDDVTAFWKRAKENERTVSFRLEKKAIEVYGEGQFAAAHYVAFERVRRLKPRTAPDGRVIPVGNETTIPIRFSDFFVREGEAWRYVGGYRDGSCSLFKGFGKTCSE